MKKITSFLLITFILFNSFTMTAYAKPKIEDKSFNSEIVLPDFNIEVKPASEKNKKLIEKKVDDMCETVLKINNTKDKMKESKSKKNDIQVQSYENEIIYYIDLYYEQQEEMLSYGAIKLNDEQVLQYIRTTNTSDTIFSLSTVDTPEISGIDFFVYYSTYTHNGRLYDMASVYALPTPNIISKLVHNYDTIEISQMTTWSNLLSQAVQMTAVEVANYLLGAATGGLFTFAVNSLLGLTGNFIPSTGYTNSARLDLAVSSSSRVIHTYVKLNGNYVFRLATNAAVIKESWIFRDVNGDHYYKYHEFWTYSTHHRNREPRAVTINVPESYNVFFQYRTRGLLGMWFSRLDVSPFFAATPGQFAK